MWTVVRVVATLALAGCRRCGRRPRVLPSDILPRKLYALPVIEHQVGGYVEGQGSLRQVAWGLAGERTPAFTTIHAWTEGLEAHAQGRGRGEVPGGMPHTALVAETEARFPPQPR